MSSSASNSNELSYVENNSQQSNKPACQKLSPSSFERDPRHRLHTSDYISPALSYKHLKRAKILLLKA